MALTVYELYYFTLVKISVLDEKIKTVKVAKLASNYCKQC